MTRRKNEGDRHCSPASRTGHRQVWDQECARDQKCQLYFNYCTTINLETMDPGWI